MMRINQKEGRTNERKSVGRSVRSGRVRGARHQRASRVGWVWSNESSSNVIENGSDGSERKK